jgi:hypothetical protein
MLIASRELTQRKGGKDSKIAVRIDAPTREATGAWSCQYEIDWPDKKSMKQIFGFDSMQAIVLALQTIGAEIYTSNYHKSGELFFDVPDRGYGFPVVPTYRNLLQGDDAKYL